jgi:hypothetical protein
MKGIHEEIFHVGLELSWYQKGQTMIEVEFGVRFRPVSMLFQIATPSHCRFCFETFSLLDSAT